MKTDPHHRRRRIAVMGINAARQGTEAGDRQEEREFNILMSYY